MRNVDDAEASAAGSCTVWSRMESKRVICMGRDCLIKKNFRQLRITSGRPSLSTDSFADSVQPLSGFCCPPGRAEEAAEVFQAAVPPSAAGSFLSAPTGECDEQARAIIGALVFFLDDSKFLSGFHLAARGPLGQLISVACPRLVALRLKVWSAGISLSAD